MTYTDLLQLRACIKKAYIISFKYKAIELNYLKKMLLRINSEIIAKDNQIVIHKKFNCLCGRYNK